MAQDPVDTYTAFYEHDHSCIVYRSKQNDGTLERLPQGAKPVPKDRSTYFREDGGDRYEWAWFETERGQYIIIQKDGVVPCRRKK